MADFEDRKRGFEGKFVHDEELRFKAVSRANRLVGQWAAELLGKTGDEADAYVKAVVGVGFAASGRDGIVAKLKDDLGDRVGEAAILARMDAALVEAQEQLADMASN
jgi:hypothetical protein